MVLSAGQPGKRVLKTPSVPKSRQVAQGEIVSLFSDQDLAEGVPSNRGLNCVLYVGDIHAVARSLIALYRDVEIWLADDTKHAKVFNTLDWPHDRNNLVRPGFQSP